jgi:DNA ligase-1
MRECFWEAADELIGNIVEVRADAITQNQDGTYSLRFPRFLRFRGFDAGEKI